MKKDFFHRLVRNGGIYRFDLHVFGRKGCATYTITQNKGDFHFTDTAKVKDGTFSGYVHDTDGSVIYLAGATNDRELADMLLDYHLAHHEVAERRRTDENELQQVRDALVAKRKELGMTQAEVARLMRSTPAAVTDFERRDSLGWQALVDYATAVGVRLHITLK